MSSPPRAGPKVAPTVPAVAQIAIPRFVEPARPARSGSEPASSRAPPKPCTARAAMSTVRLFAKPHVIEAARNTTRPASTSGAGRNRRTNGSSASVVMRTTRLYAVMTQEIPTMEVSRSTYSSGSASTTIDESAKATATATARAISSARVRFMGQPAASVRIRKPPWYS